MEAGNGLPALPPLMSTQNSRPTIAPIVLPLPYQLAHLYLVKPTVGANWAPLLYINLCGINESQSWFESWLSHMTGVLVT